MANRVTANDVKEILETGLADSVVDVFIISANLLTDKIAIADHEGALSSSHLKEIERWLAAHFVAIRDVRVGREQAGPVSQHFQYKVDLNLNQTQYGQQAILLDVTGYLANLQATAEDGKKVKAGMSLLGSPESSYPTDSVKVM